MPFPIVAVLGTVFKPLVDLIDEFILSPEEKLNAKQQLFQVQVDMYSKVLDYETKIAEAQSRIIVAEASSESWITRTWRPILMLVFGGLVVARWFGFSAPDIPVEIESQLWTIIQIGLGGYVGGRSLEKIATVVGEVINKKTEA